MFHKILLLAPGGRTVYQGGVLPAKNYFESFRFHMDGKTNPADFYMDVISGRELGNHSHDVKKLPDYWLNRVQQTSLKNDKRTTKDNLLIEISDSHHFSESGYNRCLMSRSDRYLESESKCHTETGSSCFSECRSNSDFEYNLCPGCRSNLRLESNSDHCTENEPNGTANGSFLPRECRSSFFSGCKYNSKGECNCGVECGSNLWQENESNHCLESESVFCTERRSRNCPEDRFCSKSDSNFGYGLGDPYKSSSKGKKLNIRHTSGFTNTPKQ